MSITVVGSGTQTAVINTEHSLYSDTVSGTFVFRVNLVNMAAGDLLELRMKSKVLSGDTLAVVYKYSFYNAAAVDNIIQQSVPVVSDIGVTCTLKQTQGTGRSFTWSVLQL